LCRLQTKAPPTVRLTRLNKRQCLIDSRGTRELIASSRAITLPVFAWHVFVWWREVPHYRPVLPPRNGAICCLLFVCSRKARNSCRYERAPSRDSPAATVARCLGVAHSLKRIAR
jgi:hypothetical protein